MNVYVPQFDAPSKATVRRPVDGLMANLDVRPALARSELSLLVATHEMGFAREVADRLVFMDADEIVETATPATFFENSETE